MASAGLKRWGCTVLTGLLRAHDALTQLSFRCAIVAVAYLTLVLAWEVFARYVLQKPSGWAPDTASLSFALSIFLAAPYLSKNFGHVSMDAIIKAVPQQMALWMQRLVYLAAALICFVSAYFGYLEFVRLYTRGVKMIAVTSMPKWWLMLAIVYALASMGIHFLRHFCSLCWHRVAPADKG